MEKPVSIQKALNYCIPVILMLKYKIKKGALSSFEAAMLEFKE